MSHIDEHFNHLQGVTAYAAFDFVDALLSIQIHPDDSDKTAFHGCTSKVNCAFWERDFITISWDRPVRLLVWTKNENAATRSLFGHLMSSPELAQPEFD